MTSLFDKELEEMEREVRDLKTVHLRGLGTIVFYSKTNTYTIPANKQLNWTISLQTDEPAPALISISWTQAYSTRVIETASDSITGSIGGGTSGRTVVVKVVGSSSFKIETEII